ncbi:transketolase [Variovorax sp. CYS-02]|uniref:Transketolase n=2 Tax=Variovorax terrae TaxID=2923278 RepID=A0A9X2AL40_9BURK|nr:transketolase [Variovorax terrae]
MHHDSGVGHIGGNLSSLDSLLVLFHEFLGPKGHLVLSKGHSAGALYVAMWSSGRLPEEALSTFHRDATLLPGHPPAQGHADILFATGSLGHGLSLAAGTAFAKQLRGVNAGEELAHVYCMTSDGEWQEGSTWEALIFAQHRKLDNLTVFIDHNELQGFGSTGDIASMAPLWEKVRGFDVDVSVIDGHNLAEIRTAAARRGNKPHFVFMKTTKGKGVSFMEHRMEWHYLPINAEKLESALAELS